MGKIYATKVGYLDDCCVVDSEWVDEVIAPVVMLLLVLMVLQLTMIS